MVDKSTTKQEKALRNEILTKKTVANGYGLVYWLDFLSIWLLRLGISPKRNFQCVPEAGVSLGTR